MRPTRFIIGLAAGDVPHPQLTGLGRHRDHLRVGHLSAQPERCHSVSSQSHNKSLVRLIVERMFNHGDLDVAEKIFAPDFVDRGHEQVADKQDGPAGFAHFVATIRAALPDLNAKIENLVAEGEMVAMWNTATATHRGELFGMPPTGEPIRMKDFHFFRFHEGKIVEHWNSVSFG